MVNEPIVPYKTLIKMCSCTQTSTVQHFDRYKYSRKQAAGLKDVLGDKIKKSNKIR